MSGIQVRLGWWRQRCGHVVRVESLSENGPLRWRDCVSTAYTDGGRIITYLRNVPPLDEPEDLVEFLGEEIEVRRVR
jgi:hypothetical protein